MAIARTTLVLARILVLTGIAACGSETPEPAPPSAVPPVPELTPTKSGKQELLVLAASSLTDAFKELEQAHELANPDLDVMLSLSGSSVLAMQVDQGGSGDVLALASEEQMQGLIKSGLIKEHAVFAHNELVIAVPPGNPAKLERFEDLAQAKKIVLGTPNVPVGKYADALITRAGEKLGSKFSDAVSSQVVSREANVRLVLAKVQLGEADAAIVYRTDIQAESCKAPSPTTPAKPCERAQAIAIPAELNMQAAYPIGIPTRSKQQALGRAFMKRVLSAEGQAVLAKHGFGAAMAPNPEPAK